jgi:hypothetical protein
MRFACSIFSAVLLFTSFSRAQAPAAVSQEPPVIQPPSPCSPNPREKAAEANLAQIQVAIAFYLGKYGEYPASFSNLGPPADGEKPSAKTAGLLNIQELTPDNHGYKFRYERMPDGFGLWATPEDFAEGCGSVFMDKDGNFRRHWQMGEASAADPVMNRGTNLTGHVVLQALIDTKGHAIEAVPLEGPSEFYLRAVQNALAMKFQKPKGRAPVRTNLDFDFHLWAQKTQPANNLKQ